MTDLNAIELNIKPLVDALNATGLLQTFSSCEGHYEPADQNLRDRNHAEVRFIPLPAVSPEQIDRFLGNLLTAYKKRYGIMPMQLVGYKLFTPIDGIIEETYVLELRPFNRFDPPHVKRADTDRAIGQVVAVVGAL